MQRIFQLRPQVRLFLLGLALCSAGVLAAAFVAQYAFHLHPCHLCILQRYPYAAVILVGLTGAAFVRRARPLTLLLAICGGLLATGGGIAAYHTGVEQGIFPGPSSCTDSSGGDDSIEAMRRAILEAPLVACDQPQGEMLGLSLAAWNALIYSFLTLVAFYGVYRSLRSTARHDRHEAHSAR